MIIFYTYKNFLKIEKLLISTIENLSFDFNYTLQYYDIDGLNNIKEEDIKKIIEPYINTSIFLLPLDEISKSILEIDNGDLVLFGWTYSYSTYPNNQYDNDFWLIHYTPTEMSLSENIIVQPQNFQLYDAYPNPFNPQTAIHYMLKNDTHLKIKIHDITGKKIKTIMDGIQKAGYHNYIWNSKNDMGQNVSNGIYFYSIETQLEQKTKKMILVR